jgi:hypothetical protein
MIEDYLINYGVLGLWTLSLIYEKFNYQKQIKQVTKIIKSNDINMSKIKNAKSHSKTCCGLCW